MEIVLILFLLILIPCGGFSFLSYAFAWYENANRDPHLLAERFAPGNLWLALRLLLQECAFLVVTVLLHPFGWYTPRSLRTNPEGGTPVILLHGLFQSRACWSWFRYQLRQFGYRNAFAIPLPPWEDIDDLSRRVAAAVEEVRRELDVEKVVLVGHSMGGIVARHYLQLGDGAPKVAACVLLGVPHGGSKLVPFALSPLGSLVRPGSEFLQELADTPLPPGVAFTSVHTRHDNIVIPWENSRLPEVETVELERIGHTGLLFHPGAFAAVLEQLQGGYRVHS